VAVFTSTTHSKYQAKIHSPPTTAPLAEEAAGCGVLLAGPMRNKLLGNSSNLWQRLTGKPQAGSVTVAAQRFLRACHDHGIETTQIPRLLPEIKLGDLQSAESLLAVLTPEIIDKTAQLFGIRTQWLEGVDDELYDYLAICKEPKQLLEHLSSLLPTHHQPLSCPLRILTTTLKPDWQDESRQLFAPVLIEKIAELGEQEIKRYHIYRDGMDWGYAPTRFELKAIAWLVFHKLHATIPMYLISEAAMDDVLAGKTIPAQLLRGSLSTHPSLEDFVLTQEQSRVAKETDELPAVLRYLEENDLRNFTFTRQRVSAPLPEPPSTADNPPEPQRPPLKPGKRQALAEHWKAIRVAATAIWAREPLTIQAMILRLRQIPQLKATAFSDSAIRKHIAALAPEGIRGKSGRKPNQST
jgi:hypothetical protein